MLPSAQLTFSMSPLNPVRQCASGRSMAVSRWWSVTTTAGLTAWPAASCHCMTVESASHLRPSSRQRDQVLPRLSFMLPWLLYECCFSPRAAEVLFVSETCFDTCFCLLLLLLMSFALSQSQQLMLVEVQSWFFSLEAVVEKMSPPQGPFSSYPGATRQLPMDLVVRLFSQLFPSSRINFEPWLLS